MFDELKEEEKLFKEITDFERAPPMELFCEYT